MMMKKAEYRAPEAEYIALPEEDVLRTSWENQYDHGHEADF